MKQLRLFTIGMFLLLLVSPGLASFTGEAEAEEYLLALVNEARQENGLPALISEPLLTQAARGHCWEMISLDYFSHDSPLPERETPLLRVTETGLTETWIGENIGSEYTSSPFDWHSLTLGIFEGLMNSPPHKENILSPDFNYAGMGLVRSEHDGMSGLHATQLFMTRRIRLDGFRVVPTEDGYGLELWGRQLAPGYLKLIIRDEVTEYYPLETDAGGFFREVVLFPPGNSYEVSLGLGEELYGSINVYNVFRVSPALETR